MNGIVVSLADLLSLKGEAFVADMASRFSCGGRNSEVEDYLKETAIRHTLKNTSITHLVMRPDCSDCLAYYTLAMKPFAISADRLNNRQKKEMRDVAKVRKDNREFSIAAYLIAQLARNFAAPEEWRVTGRDLFACIFSQVAAIRKQIGGKVVFVEYERDKAGLQKFYQDNGFEEFKVPSDEDAKGKLGQLFYFLSDDFNLQPITGGNGS